MAIPSFSDFAPLVNHLVYRVLPRLRAVRSALDGDDLRQEAHIIYLRAAQKWSPEGASFAFYYRSALVHEFNRLVEMEARQGTLIAASLDDTAHLDSARSLHETVPADVDDPEDILLRRDRAKMVGRLSERARRLVDLMMDPPPFLLAQLDGLKARSHWARSRGFPAPEPQRLTLTMVADFLGFSDRARRQVYAEITALAEKVSKC